MAGALIITADFEPADFAWFDQLRRTHYPIERNRLPAHLTMFHALPPSAETEVRTVLSRIALSSKPIARIEGLLDLGGGVAFRIASDELDGIRAELADHLHGLLSAQDLGGWRPHVTIQNKVQPKVARALLADLQRGFRARELVMRGLGLNRYLDGPWANVATYPFRGR